MNRKCEQLLNDVRACRLCEPHLAAGVRPVLQLHPRARLLIAGQAPGRKVHESGVPFDDASGDRLREWLGLSREQFYDPSLVAILPMGFCYPGKGKSGDLPPRPECAPQWRQPLLEQLHNLRLSLLIGDYAQAWHLPQRERNLTETVRNWRAYCEKSEQEQALALIPLPHPSPRNNIWLKKNPWFNEDLLPSLRARVALAIEG
jgi:uracil-DNA glycosylase